MSNRAFRRMIERRRAATNYVPPVELQIPEQEESVDVSEQLDNVKLIWKSLNEELDNVLESDDNRFEVVFLLQERINKIFEENA